jgi:hypothetical protein
MPPEGVTIRLDDKRRNLALWWQKVQNVVGGAPLLMAGIHRVSAPGGSGDVLALAEIVVATVLLVLFARDVRAEARARLSKVARAPRHESISPEWFDVVAGMLLILEAVHSTHPGGKPLLHHALLYLGAATVASGLASGLLADRLSKRRYIQLDDEGVHARFTRFRKFEVAWREVSDVQLRDDAIVIVSGGEQKLIPLRRYANASEIRAAFASWRERLAPAAR